MRADRQALADAFAAWERADAAAQHPDPRWSAEDLYAAHYRRSVTAERLLTNLRALLAEPEPEATYEQVGGWVLDHGCPIQRSEGDPLYRRVPADRSNEGDNRG